ncbi:Nucleosome assembly protein 1-like 1 [Hordeum vulgare]|nr:Nucleosome assembly protein 1-like 1 [Hordeum vulgare]
MQWRITYGQYYISVLIQIAEVWFKSADMSQIRELDFMYLSYFDVHLNCFEVVVESQHDEFEAKFFEERAALEAKYQKMYEPLYSKRHDVVNGVVEVEGVTKDDSGEAAADQKANSGFVVPLVICCLAVSELGAGAKSLLLSLEPPSSSDASGEYFFSDHGLGILEPIKAGIRDAKLGVGKQEQDDFFTASANFCIIF